MSFNYRSGKLSVPTSDVGSNLSSDTESDHTPANKDSSHSVKSPVLDFRKSLEDQKNICKYVSKLGDMAQSVPKSLRNERNIEMIEKNYKLQVQTLLEEVNQLKLDKKILEKKLERVQKGGSTKKITSDTSRDTLDESLITKRTMEAKNSTIKELEFQISQLNNENANLKMRMRTQNAQLEDLRKRVTDCESMKQVVEEKDEEITSLKESLEAESAKQEKMLQELSYLRNENIALKLKFQCPSCGQTTGTTSFVAPTWNNTSKDLSFFSSADKHGHGHGHKRASSDVKFMSKILNLSEIHEDHKGWGTPYASSSKMKGVTFSSHYKDMCVNEPTKPVVKSGEGNRRENFSVKVLREYEKGLKSEKQEDSKKDTKTLDRIIEINKFKSYVIEEQNKKLLSILNAAKEEKTSCTEISNM